MTATTAIRVSRRIREIIRELSQDSGLPMQTIVEEAIKTYQGQWLLEATNAVYAALQSDPQAWQELLEERAEWDVTLLDGLEGV